MKNIDLAGPWSAYLDREDRGIGDRWYEGFFPSADAVINLPGCLEENRLGDPVGPETQWVGSKFGQEFYEDDLYQPYRSSEKYRFIYWLQPESRYLGAAWYERRIDFPPDMNNSRWRLTMERVHWETRVWFDGKPLGKRDSLSAPHEYVIERAPNQGTGRLVIRVDNRMIHDVGPNAHSVSDQTQGSWNGIVGELSLKPLGSCRIEKYDFIGNPSRRSAILKLEISNNEDQPFMCELSVISPQKRKDSSLLEKSSLTLSPGNNEVFREIEFEKDLLLWDEHHPQLVILDLVLTKDGRVIDSRHLTSGLRTISGDKDRILINGKAVSFRGTLECCVFPGTGYPPTDGDSWRKVYEKLKAFGMNHMRFHSWCPPEAAFQEADKMGIYLQVECPLWKNQGSRFEGDPDFDNWLFHESERIVEKYGHHPSFVLFNSGNEPDGRDKDFLGAWVHYWKNKDGRRLYTSSSGWPTIEENQFHVTPTPRIQAWGEGLESRINSKAPETLADYHSICRNYDSPVITHENGQWCAFPDFSEIRKYTGYLKAKNFEVFQDILKRRGMEHRAGDFLHASGKQQLLCYKEEIESNLRTGNLSGFQLLGLTDFPGQGTALVGVLNAFWEEKGYCRAEDFRRFCGEVVLLARLSKRIFRENERLDVLLDVYNYSDREYDDAVINVSLKDENRRGILFREIQNPHPIKRGLTRVSDFTLSLAELPAPARYTLEIEFPEADAVNDWDIWLYPEKIEMETGQVERYTNPEKAFDALRDGKKVLLTAPPSIIDTDVKTGFSSVFWNTSWTGGQAPHTLGLCCDSGHSVFRQFPTENHGNWQWWEPLHDAASMILDSLPRELEPIIQPIDTWFRSHKLALLFECRCGRGQLMVSSINFDAPETKPVSSQLLSSIYAYMNGKEFEPSVEIDSEELMKIFKTDGAQKGS